MHRPASRFRVVAPLAAVLLLAACADGAATAPRPHAALLSHTALPASATLAGSLQSELGCAGDWDPSCGITLLGSTGGGVWRGTFAVPAGAWEYKVALNGTWDESYGGPAGNRPLSLPAAGLVRFYYDHDSHWVADDRNDRIAVAPGSFQSELGCPGDWMPECLRSWLRDADGDGVLTFITTDIPPGHYEAKVAIRESWDENYGAGGAMNGPTIPFTVAAIGQPVTFSFHSASNVLTVLANRSPTASAGGPYAGVEGQALTFTGSGNDADGDALAYAWDLDGDGTFESAGATAGRPFADDGTYPVTLRVTDAHGAATTSTAMVTVSNAPPVIRTLRLDVAILNRPAVGQPFPIDVVWSDRGLHDAAWSWTIEWGDGQATAGTRIAQQPFGGSHAYATSGRRTVRLVIIDKDGSTATRTFPVEVR